MKIKLLATAVVVLIFGIGIGILFDKQTKPNVSVFESNPNPLNIPIPPNWKAKESEPGNSFATSDVITPGYDTQGTLNPGNILDYYTFTLKDPAKIIVTVSNLPQDFGFILYNSSLTEVAHTYRLGSSEGTTAISLNDPGKYYLKVFGDYTQVVNIPYTIRVSVLPFFSE